MACSVVGWINILVMSSVIYEHAFYRSLETRSAPLLSFPLSNPSIFVLPPSQFMTHLYAGHRTNTSIEDIA